MAMLGVCVVAAFAVLCVLPGASAQQKNVFRWKVQDYPDPFSFDTYSQCGRTNKSNVCDPNRIISKKQADDIDSLIWSVYRETECACQSCITNRHGYVIRVAIMPRMESIIKHGNSSADRVLDAQMFSYILTKKWAMGGSCNESLLILYSRYDGVLYTLTLPHARLRLDDETVKRISINVRPLFDQENTVGEGLKEMIKRYKMVFNGNEKEALRPKVSPQKGSGAPDSTPYALSLLLSGLLIAVAH